MFFPDQSANKTFSEFTNKMNSTNILDERVGEVTNSPHLNVLETRGTKDGNYHLNKNEAVKLALSTNEDILMEMEEESKLFFLQIKKNLKIISIA